VRGDPRAILMVRRVVCVAGCDERFIVEAICGAIPRRDLGESAAPAPTKKNNAIAASGKRPKVKAQMENGCRCAGNGGRSVLKEFRYLTRNGMAFLTLLLPPIMVVFFTLQFGKGSALRNIR